MKAYVDVKQMNRGGWQGWYAEVVTEQDYHEGGPFAHSYRSPLAPDKITASNDAHAWAHKTGCTVTTPEEVAGA